jgi:GMP synthase (glutamine-hydrolysing)
VRVLAIHHEDWKLYLLRASSRQKHRNLGSLAHEIRAAGLACDYHEAAIGQPLRCDLASYSHVVILGGNMAAYDEDHHPFLRDELQIIEQALGRGLPVLGICLGAQLLARVHGARVYPGARGPELAWQPIALTGEGRAEPWLRSYPAAGPAFQWHHDSFDLPTGAVRLARSDVYDNQAFRVGRQLWAFQFHLEADELLIRDWLRTHGRNVGWSAAEMDAARQDTARHIAGFIAAGRDFMRAFLGQEAATRGG